MFVLHIGKHKTGSSSIQQFLAANADRLEALGVLYPKTGMGKKAHHALAHQLKQPDGPASAEWEEVVALEQANRDKKVVLSSEAFETLRRKQVKALKHRLGQAEVQVVIYVRELTSALPSRYNQLTKKGINLRGFDAFYAEYGPANGYNLHQAIEMWGDVFGWERMRVRLLDPASLAGGTLIGDVLDALGLTLADLGGPAAAGLGPTNVSLGWKPLEILRALALELTPHIGQDPDKPNRLKRENFSTLRGACERIAAELELGKDKAQYLTAQQHAECLAAWTREVTALNARIIGPKLPLPDAAKPVKDRPFLPGIEQIPPEERHEFAASLDAELRRKDAGLPDALRERLVAVVAGPEKALRAALKAKRKARRANRRLEKAAKADSAPEGVAKAA